MARSERWMPAFFAARQPASPGWRPGKKDGVAGALDGLAGTLDGRPGT